MITSGFYPELQCQKETSVTKFYLQRIMLGWVGRCMSGGQTIRWEAAEESGARRKTVLVRMEKKEQVRDTGCGPPHWAALQVHLPSRSLQPSSLKSNGGTNQLGSVNRALA